MAYTTQTHTLDNVDKTVIHSVTGTGPSPQHLAHALTVWPELADHPLVYTVHPNPDKTKTVKIWRAR